MILALALIGAISNSFFRGGFIKKWFPRFRGGKVINAAIFGLCGYYTSHYGLYASLMAVAMYIGQAHAIFHPDTDKYKADGVWSLWAAVVAERGLIWSIPLIAVSWPMFGERALIWAALAVVMPLAYSLDWSRYWWRWAGAEAIFGAFLWVLLGLLSG